MLCQRLRLWQPMLECWCRCLLLLFGKQQRMTHVLLPPTWKTQIEFPAVGFSLVPSLATATILWGWTLSISPKLNLWRNKNKSSKTFFFSFQDKDYESNTQRNLVWVPLINFEITACCMISNINPFKGLFYVFEQQSDKERRDRFSIWWLIPQVAKTDLTEPKWCQDWKTPSSPHTWLAVTLVHLPFLPQ